jgi:RNA polymerase sigma-70 factor (ECF subfamily)
VLTIVRNTALTWMAKNRPANVTSTEGVDGPLELPELTDPAPSAEQIMIARADQGAVRAAIAALPQAFREAIVMREINGLSYREIADASGIPIGTVMSRLARARMMLMTALGRPA